jgi:hypothetical protein
VLGLNGKIMKFRNYMLIVASLFVFSVVEAKDTYGPSPNKEGELGLVIVASDGPEFIEEWLSTPSTHAVSIKRLTKVVPDQLIVTAFLVTGFTQDAEGNYSFRVSYSLIGPDKKVVFGDKNYANGKGKSPEKPTFVMADPALDIYLSDEDEVGVYTIVGIVEDVVSKKKSKSVYQIRLIKIIGAE